eukprot:gnl/Carplike_NY0171/1425_a1938_1602.p1 GENE.gnl/Carplike_NY0171/1425_a1938_1602~~gnl/Carplike_NY0171/1425_a1938_1602.p1  ORF type:complete len:165 (-),score=27.12 gnl/Carplike_NY0171/1425_a1938_1602:144-638(-)
MTNTFNDWLESMPGPLYSQIGIALAIVPAIFGAAWGIALSGVSMVGGANRKPDLTSKNMLSILFCEATAIIALIMSITLRYTTKDADAFSTNEDFLISSFQALFAGLAVGFSSMFSGISVGLMGGGIALATISNVKIFSALFICEVFASAICLIALISGIVVIT